MRLAAMIAIGIALPGWAKADVGAIVASGNAAERDRSVVVTAIGTAAKGAGWALADHPMNKKETDAVSACMVQAKPWTCLPPSITKMLGRMIVVQVDNDRGDDGSPIVVVTAKVLIADPVAVVGDRRFCEHCAADSLAKTATDLTNELLEEIAVHNGTAVVVVHSTPTGARILFDGQPIGATDWTFNTSPGHHTITLDKPGYQSETRPVDVVDNTTATITVALRPTGAAPPRTTSPVTTPTPSHLLPAVVIGGGVAVAITGIVLYATDEDPSPTGGKTYRDTAPLGVGVTLGGLAVIGVGAYLWHRISSAAVTPTMASTAGGGIIGLSGSF